MLCRGTLTVGLACLVIIGLAETAAACACCVNRGYYEHTRERPGELYGSLFEKIRFAPSAELYVTEGGFDHIKGLPDLAKDEAEGKIPALRVTGGFSRNMWRLTVAAGEGRNGTISLRMPALFTKHKVDIDGVDTGLGVDLYKEFTINGRVAGASGILRSANHSTRYTLIFQGRGNGCDDALDLTRWRLELKGPRAEYAFFGSTKQ